MRTKFNFLTGKKEVALEGAEAGFGCLFIIAVWVVFATPLAWCWDYSVSQWLLWMGKPDKFNMWWHGYALAFIPGVGQLGLAAAVVTFVATFFI